jgi:conjugative relaxase-like TrwC/TraI family protein
VHGLVRESVVTVRVTTLRGSQAGAYYVERELGYYLDDDEPPGQWHGRAVAELGLEGVVVDDDFLALMDGLDPRTGELLGTGHTERTVRGFDVTCSAPKSVSVLYALGDDHVRSQALAAHDAAVDAVVGWIEAHAHTRFRVAGEVCTFDADGIVAAHFRQHTSRSLDPQVHTHVVIPNRVQASDGRWLALDARTIKRDQQTLSRLYHAGLRAELTDRLAVRWREPDRGIAEIADLPMALLAVFSQRTQAIRDRIEDKIEAFVDSHGRQPTPRERWRLERDAAAENRPQKGATDPIALETEWRDRALDLGLGTDPTDVVGHAIGRQVAPSRTVDVDELTGIALDALAESQSTWRPAEVVRELAAAVPTSSAGGAATLPGLLDNLAGQIIEARMIDLGPPVPEDMPVRRDGRPVTEAATDRRLTLPEILDQEDRILVAAQARIDTPSVDDHQVSVPDGLTIPQRRLAAAVAGTRPLVLAVGPAGSGKTAALAPAVDGLRARGRPVFGVAPSATAAEVLATDTGIDADTLDKLLIEHHLDRPPDHRYDLPARSTIIVDEAGMVPTAKLADLLDLADQRGWRLVLVGDPLQFAPVGRGAMFGLLVDSFEHIELDQIHRFHLPWEREASLQLRHGDTAAIDAYDAHGRIHGGTSREMRSAAVTAWWQAIQAGHTAAMMAPTTDAVIALNLRGQHLHRQAGHLGDQTITVGPYDISVGDLVATRANDRRLRTDRHQMVKNRDHWTVQHLHPDGALTVSGKTGHVVLPAGYVASHVELGYAETSHANQGRNVHDSYVYLDGPTDGRGIYVPMTRGRSSNHAFVTVTGEQTAADVLAEALTRDWADQPAHQVRAELHPPTRPSRTPDGLLNRAELQRLLQRHGELTDTLETIRRDRVQAAYARQGVEQQRHQLQHRLREQRQHLASALHTVAEHDRPLHRRRHRAELDDARAAVGQLPADIAAAEQALVGLDRGIDDVDERVERAERRHAQTPHLAAELALIEGRLDRDIEARGRRLASRPTADILAQIGPVPDRLADRNRWTEVAGRLAQRSWAIDGNEFQTRRDQIGVGRDGGGRGRVAARPFVAGLERSITDSGAGQEPLGLEL